MRMRNQFANRGRNWEQLLEMWHYRYETQGVASIIRTPPPVRVLRPTSKGQFIGCFTSEGPPDYILITKGVSVAMEAKETNQNRWPFARLPLHQAEKMSVWENQGGKSVILLNHKKSNSMWVIFWDKLKDRWYNWHKTHKTSKASPGTASLSFDEMPDFGMQFDSDGYLNPLMTYILDEKMSFAR